MQSYQDPEFDTTTDWAFALAFAQDQARYAFPVEPLRPCGNTVCTNQSYAIYCSEGCRVTVETDHEPADDDTYYSDGEGVLLGHRQLSDTQAALDGDNLAALVCGYGPQAIAAPVPAFSEAPVSCTVKGFRHGQDTMVTIRGADFASVQAQVEAASQWFDAPAAAPAQSTPVETGDGWCSIHATPMRWNPGKGGESGWWSHKAAEGQWCKGRRTGRQVQHG